jgi:hypothetical protein
MYISAYAILCKVRWVLHLIKGIRVARLPLPLRWTSPLCATIDISYLETFRPRFHAIASFNNPTIIGTAIGANNGV